MRLSDAMTPARGWEEAAMLTAQPRTISGGAALNALRQAIKHCTVLEINTGGVARGFRNEFYPAPFLLEEWRKLGGKVIITCLLYTSPSPRD